MQEIFLEAESLKNKGGWVVDSGSMETLHSAYLMAHGMGIPVADAFDSIEIACDGEYSVWALTRDWTATWNIADPAGKFEILLDGKPLSHTLGTNGKAWSWQLAGQQHLAKGIHTLSLHDLTGFNGRCDAIYLTDSGEIPPSDAKSLDEMRRRLNWKKDIGWWHLKDGSRANNSHQPCDSTQSEIEKFRYCVERLGIEHKYPMPEKWGQK